jgi:hypothetical protein
VSIYIASGDMGRSVRAPNMISRCRKAELSRWKSFGILKSPIPVVLSALSILAVVKRRLSFELKAKRILVSSGSGILYTDEHLIPLFDRACFIFASSSFITQCTNYLY